MLIRDLMTTPAVTVTAQTPIGLALRLLDDRKITAMPVVDAAGVLVGIVSEADLVQEEGLLDDQFPKATVRTTTDTPAASTTGMAVILRSSRSRSARPMGVCAVTVTAGVVIRSRINIVLTSFCRRFRRLSRGTRARRRGG